MPFTKAENNLQQSASKAIANYTQGNGGISMPAVPVLQNKPIQKNEEEQQRENLPDADQQQATQLKSVTNDLNTGVVQREVENAKVGTGELDAVAVDFFKHVNGLAQEAYAFAVHVPNLGPYAGLDGHTELWKEKWDAYLAGAVVPLMAATFGYVVESLVSNAMGPYHPVAPTGYTIYYQVISGGTRPDLVLRERESGEDIAWVDLTASGSGGHIFDKDSWDKKVARYAEVTYPSVSTSTLFLMKDNRDNTTGLSQEEFNKRKKEVEKAYAIRKERWVNWGEKYKYSNLKNEIDYSTETLNLNPALKRNFIKNRLQKDFDVDAISEALVPSILYAMNVGPGPWGFETGTSASQASGEAWLTDHDPTAEDITPPTKMVEEDTP